MFLLKFGDSQMHYNASFAKYSLTKAHIKGVSTRKPQQLGKSFSPPSFQRITLAPPLQPRTAASFNFKETAPSTEVVDPRETENSEVIQQNLQKIAERIKSLATSVQSSKTIHVEDGEESPAYPTASQPTPSKAEEISTTAPPESKTNPEPKPTLLIEEQPPKALRIDESRPEGRTFRADFERVIPNKETPQSEIETKYLRPNEETTQRPPILESSTTIPLLASTVSTTTTEERSRQRENAEVRTVPNRLPAEKHTAMEGPDQKWLLSMLRESKKLGLVKHNSKQEQILPRKGGLGIRPIVETTPTTPTETMESVRPTAAKSTTAEPSTQKSPVFIANTQPEANIQSQNYTTISPPVTEVTSFIAQSQSQSSGTPPTGAQIPIMENSEAQQKSNVDSSKRLTKEKGSQREEDLRSKSSKDGTNLEQNSAVPKARIPEPRWAFAEEIVSNSEVGRNGMQSRGLIAKMEKAQTITKNGSESGDKMPPASPFAEQQNNAVEGMITLEADLSSLTTTTTPKQPALQSKKEAETPSGTEKNIAKTEIRRPVSEIGQRVVHPSLELDGEKADGGVIPPVPEERPVFDSRSKANNRFPLPSAASVFNPSRNDSGKNMPVESVSDNKSINNEQHKTSTLPTTSPSTAITKNNSSAPVAPGFNNTPCTCITHSLITYTMAYSKRRMNLVSLCFLY